MTRDDFATYSAVYADQHGLVPIDDADAQRIATLAQRAVLAGRGIPRQADKALEPIIDFKAADVVAKRGF